MARREILQFFQNISKIEGPISARLEKNDSAGNYVFFLGDFHTEKRVCAKCTRPECATLYDYSLLILIDKFAQEYGLNVDFIYESWWLDPAEKQTFSEVSALAQYVQTRHQFDRIKSHKGDPRFYQGNLEIIQDAKYQADMLISYYMFNLNQLFLHYKDMDKLALFNIWERALLNSFPGEDINSLTHEMLRMITFKSTLDEMESNPFCQKFSRTLHEFNKIPQHFARTIRKNARQIYTPGRTQLKRPSFLRAAIKLVRAIGNTLDREQILPQLDQLAGLLARSDEAHEMLLKLTDAFLIFPDIYSISRYLKYKNVDLTILYFGQEHIKNMTKLLHGITTTKIPYFEESFQCVIQGSGGGN